MSVLPVLRPQVIVTIHAPEMSGEDNVKGGTVRAWQGARLPSWGACSGINYT